MSPSRVLGALGDLAPGEPRVALARADELDDHARALGEAVEVAAVARAVSVQGWSGAAADAFAEGIAEVEPSVGALVRRAGSGGDALRGWARELAELQQEAEDLVRRHRAARSAAEDALDGAATADWLSVVRTASRDRALAEDAARARASAEDHDEEVRRLEQLGRRLQDRHATAARRAADALTAAAGATPPPPPAGLLLVVRELAASAAAATAGLGGSLLGAAVVLALGDAPDGAGPAAVRDGAGGPTTVRLGSSGGAVVVPGALPVLVDHLVGPPSWELAPTRVPR